MYFVFDFIYFKIKSSGSSYVSNTGYFFFNFLALRVVLVAKLLISGILSSTILILVLYTSFLTISFFTKSVYFNQQEPLLIYHHLIYLLDFQIA